MNSVWMILCTAAAALPAGLIVSNLRLYKALPEPNCRTLPTVSVLIPARNEESNIRGALESILQCEGLEFEVLVWDDGSTDSTVEIVGEIALRDGRVRLIRGTPLPDGWAGKPHGCWSLAEQAKGEVLLFLDADVRLRRADSLARMSGAFLRKEVDLLSGVPLQRVKTLSEIMIVPLIHFVLLGFLPITKMRATCDPRFAAACGQLMLFRRSAYFEVGGHSATRGSFHEGVGLARVVRSKQRVADLFDATAVAVCRMYDGLGEVWRGFAKNAHEGMASRKAVLPFSLILFFGQVFPLLALFSGALDHAGALWAFAALGLSFLSRGMLAVRFSQPVSGVCLQPLAVAMLLLNQWYGALRFWAGKPVGWRGRTGLPSVLAAAAIVCQSPALEAAVEKCPDISLEDQHGVLHEIKFPRPRPVYIVAANRAGTRQIAGWVKPIAEAYGERVEILGLADVRGVPSGLRGAVRLLVRDGTRWPVLMDWHASIVPQICSPESSSEVFVIQRDGKVRLHISGASTSMGVDKVRTALDGIFGEYGVKKSR